MIGTTKSQELEEVIITKIQKSQNSLQDFVNKIDFDKLNCIDTSFLTLVVVAKEIASNLILQKRKMSSSIISIKSKDKCKAIPNLKKASIK